MGIRRHSTQHVERPVTTIDAFMETHGVPHAHFASIDTEGEDPLVMFGMARTLAEKRIDVLEFEFNRFGFARSNAVCTHRADVIAVFRTCQRPPYCRPLGDATGR